MGAGTITTLSGVGAPCQRYGALDFFSVSNEPKPGGIQDTGGGAASLSYFRINMLEVGRRHHYSCIVGTS